MRTLISLIFLACAVLSVVTGKAETYHMTEGEALINGWYYWLALIVFSILSVASATHPDR